MASTAYKGRKTNIMNFLGRRIHLSFFHSTFNSLFTSEPRIPICRFTEMSKGLITAKPNSGPFALQSVNKHSQPITARVSRRLAGRK